MNFFSLCQCFLTAKRVLTDITSITNTERLFSHLRQGRLSSVDSKISVFDLTSISWLLWLILIEFIHPGFVDIAVNLAVTVVWLVGMYLCVYYGNECVQCDE